MRVFLLTLLLAGCATTPCEPTILTRVVEQPVEVYVPIDDKYTEPCDWQRSAPIEQVFEVNRGRKRCLEVYEADRKTIRQIEGKPKP